MDIARFIQSRGNHASYIIRYSFYQLYLYGGTYAPVLIG
jgi:hypothetical protein